VSIDFSKITGLSDSKGVITQIADASGRVIWAVKSGGKVILEVEKITSDTYAGETTYTGEQFILLDIYPKTNGTVKVTYGGLTKTITDTSGAAEPNAQQVFFGTFNGVADEVSTPASGELTIEGDYRGFGNGSFSTSSKVSGIYFTGIMGDVRLGDVEILPSNAFNQCAYINTIIIPTGVTEIGVNAFHSCTGLTSVTFEDPYDWYVTQTEGGDVSTGTVVDVTNATENVTLVTNTYEKYYWYKS
jgi:hypothetical protein